MSANALKTRARNLQQALSEFFRQPVKLSQAYELIAREEGFKNWDSASPALKDQTRAASPKTNCATCMLITHRRHADGFSLERIISEDPSVGFSLDAISRGLGLTVITGRTGSGKSSFASGMLLREVKDRIRPTDLSAQARSEGFENALKMAFRCSPDVIYVGELRSIDHVRLAVSAVKSGHRVIATLHGTKDRTLYESLCYTIRGAQESGEAEGFRVSEGWAHHHIHIELD